MMILGQEELRTGEVESGLGSKRVSGMGIEIEGLQRPCDQRTSGEGAQIKVHQMVGEARKSIRMMGPGTRTSQEATLGLGLKEMAP